MLNFKEQALLFEKILLERQKNGLFANRPVNLYEPCSYMLQLGGKRIRPAVCLMAAELFGSAEENKDAQWAALAVELFHNFTLLHDDIMDNSPLRRGQATVFKKYGSTVAILSGDVMSIYAYQCLQNCDKTILTELLTIFNKTAIEVCEGQQLDMDFEKQDSVEVEEYIEMISMKTAVLLAASMQMGAICAHATEKQAQALYDFGLNLGIAFQLQDDYLDTFGTQESVGKKIGGDIQANKKTYLAIQARLHANGNQQGELEALNSIVGDEKTTQTIALFNELKVDKACKNAIESYTQKALHSLDLLELPKERTQAFSDLLHYLMERSF